MGANAGPATNVLVDGRFELLSPLADQGLGESWKARDANLKNRSVALKFLRPLPSAARELPAELAAHFKRLKSLRHAYVLATTHFGLWEGRPYVVQDLFEGPSLGAGLAAEGERLPAALLERFFDRVAACIDATHGAKSPVVHGALHPGCVLIQRLDAQTFDVRITDFGLASWAALPAAVVTAPEAASGTELAATVDVFGLGGLIRSMFGARANPAQRREDVAAEVWQSMRAAMQPRPEDRIASVTALREAFQSAWTSPVTPLTNDELAVAVAATAPISQAPWSAATASSFGQATMAMPNPHHVAAAASAFGATVAMPNPHAPISTAASPRANFGETVHVPNVSLGRTAWDVPGQVYAETVAMPASAAVRLPYTPAGAPLQKGTSTTGDRSHTPRDHNPASSSRITMIAVGTTIAVAVVGLVAAGVAWLFFGL